MHPTSPGDRPTDETIELPLTEPTQQGLHEAVAHLYDAFATAALREGDEIPAAVFDDLEALYVATAEESLSRIRIEYERASVRDRTVEH